ncbi:2122_t:CDS:2 [Scutellospora calospora]|uniref:2122_t:CDS:1 n=1 Tax=Scutellospora calospora TaxID=85575 RepID=A0ACA9KJN9_9GLOM|nr:2122_t:CDS:2 [Scutellospora calospora]
MSFKLKPTRQLQTLIQSTSKNVFVLDQESSIVNQRNNIEDQRNSRLDQRNSILDQRNSGLYQRNSVLDLENSRQYQRSDKTQFVNREPDSETFYNKYFNYSDNDVDSILNINNSYKRKGKFINKEPKKSRLDKRYYFYNEEAIIGFLESLHIMVNTLTDTVIEMRKEQNEIYELIKLQQKTFVNQTHSHKKQWFYKTIRKAICEKMDTIKYPSNEQLDIVSKMALEIHNKGQLEAVLTNLSWRSLWNNSIISASKVKKALIEVFSKDCFPPIEYARPSADQVNAWKQKDTIQKCFEDL